MTGPLAQMYAMLAKQRDPMGTRISQPGLQPLSEYTNRQPMAFRPPGEAGPAPPVFGAGNINLSNRPEVLNPNGDVSTVRSMSANIDGREVLMPTVSEDGRIMSDDEAVRQYIKTGLNLGIFKTPADADAYAKQLHERQSTLPLANPMPPGRARPPRPANPQILSTLMGK